MPLHDHFRPPVNLITFWQGFYGGWPAVIVQHLRRLLPEGYVAEPRIHSCGLFNLDSAACEMEVIPPPFVVVETGPPDADEYEVRIYDRKRERQWVAAIEFVSPANKYRPEYRNVFVARCAALLQKGVAVSIVDLVTIRRFNLYVDLLTMIGQTDPTLGDPPPHLYAASCRLTRQGERTALQAWSHVLHLGGPLPTLPLWLSPDLVVPLDLEQSYEQACHDLWIS